MQARPYTINGSLDRESSVVKLFYGKKKYVVIKCKHEFTSLKAVEKQLATFIRGGKENESNMLLHLFRYVKENPGEKFKAVCVLQSESGYELLKSEQEELDRGRKNPDMLNNNTAAYIPQFNEDHQSYGWITKNEYLNFQKWLKGRKKKNKLHNE